MRGSPGTLAICAISLYLKVEFSAIFKARDTKFGTRVSAICAFIKFIVNYIVNAIRQRKSVFTIIKQNI